MAVERIDYTSDEEYIQALAWEREEEEAWQERQWAEEQAARKEEVLTVYENPPKSKEIYVENMQKIVDANEKLVKELKDVKG